MESLQGLVVRDALLLSEREEAGAALERPLVGCSGLERVVSRSGRMKAGGRRGGQEVAHRESDHRCESGCLCGRRAQLLIVPALHVWRGVAASNELAPRPAFAPRRAVLHAPPYLLGDIKMFLRPALM